MALAHVDATCLARARASLTPAEAVDFSRYTFEKRQRDWLMGRYVAKLAVCRAVGDTWCPLEVAIASESSGHPVFRGPDDRLAGWDLSLAHGHDRAAALVAPSRVGIDLEYLREVPPSGWRFFLTPDERAWLAEGPLGPHGEIIAWTIKEAAYKALGGETVGLLALGLEEVGAERARVSHAAGELAVRYVVADGFCLAIATPAEPGAHPAWFEHISLA